MVGGTDCLSSFAGFLEIFMDGSFVSSLHFYWVLLAIVNFSIQIAHFFHEDNQRLFLAKKVTTPGLLFFALLIVILDVGSFLLIPCAILTAMGLGEIGIEGSNVVQANKDGKNDEAKTSFIVILAGVLFLLVNVFIGVALIMISKQLLAVVIGLLISSLVLGLIFFSVIRLFSPSRDTRTQMLIYLIGVIILGTGAVADVIGGISQLGTAAVILTVSDSLVLVRMGAGFRKETSTGFRTLLGFLIVILVLYYVYMGVLIDIGSPFYPIN